MKKLSLLVSIAMVVSAPALAAPKKKKQAEPSMTREQVQNDASWRLVRDGWPIILPSWAQPVYHGMINQEQPKPDTKAKAKKKRAS